MTDRDPFPGADPEEHHALSAATVAHIERVLVEENQRLRRENATLRRDRDEFALRARVAPGVNEERIALRLALVSISWAETLEQAHKIANQHLGTGRREDGPQSPHQTGGTNPSA